MANTSNRLIEALTQRTMALPDKFRDNWWRTAALDGVQRRNAILDAIFYNVGIIDPAEMPKLAFWIAREGALLIVPPSDKGELELFLDKEEFLKRGGANVGALAVAGVGSSALGAAAFARDIANAVGAPVAAVVSGYGLSDVLTEALGGFFWFGALNSVRHAFEGLDRTTKQFTQTEAALDSGAGDEWLRVSTDTATLIDLLADKRFAVPLLIGHSKGNLVISEALYALDEKGGLARVAGASSIVTVSAKVGMPDAFAGKVLDIIGQWDSFGAMNSRIDIAADHVVPGAWHSTNPEFPMGMGINVTAVLHDVLPMLETRLPDSGMFAGVALDLPQRLTGLVAA